MHNIKDIRNNFDNFKNIIKSRNISIDLEQILDLDQKNRKLIQEKETNIFSKLQNETHNFTNSLKLILGRRLRIKAKKIL